MSSAITSRRLRKGMNAAQIDYTLMNTSKPLDAGLFSYLAARAHTRMNFLNPFFLIGALVLAVPVLIHLVRRETIRNRSVQLADVSAEGARSG